jgi:putative hemolysin
MMPLIASSAGLSVDAASDPVGTALLCVGLLGASFFFSGTETAFFSLQSVELKRFASASGSTGRRVLRLLERRPALITTLLLGNETVNITLAATTAGILSAVAPDKPWLNIALVTPTLLLCSEITPKVIAFRVNSAWASVAVWPLSVIYLIFAPIRVVVTALVGMLARPLGVPANAQIGGIAEDEFRILVEQGQASGQVNAEERELIEKVFEFDALTVQRQMTPRPEIFSLDIDTPWPELVTQVREAGWSRVPIYSDDPDNLLGVLLVKDLLRFRGKPTPTQDQLKASLVPPVFVPPSKQSDDMLEEFLTRKNHMAFVVDEYGTLVGLVTLDDLIRDLVGELSDESDEEEEAEIEQHADGMEVRAAMDLEDFSGETGIFLPEGEYHTVGGFVFHELGRLPRKGDVVEWGDHRFEVTEMDGRRLIGLRVTRADDPQTESVPRNSATPDATPRAGGASP